MTLERIQRWSLAVDHVIGIDPDRDWITGAVIDAKTTGIVATERFSADAVGYDEAVAWAEALTNAGERRTRGPSR